MSRETPNAIEKAFIHNPESESIAEKLNIESQDVCEHGRKPCYMRCGVQVYRGKWIPIPYEERINWLEQVSSE